MTDPQRHTHKGPAPPLEPNSAVRDAWIEEVVAFVRTQLDGLQQAPALGPEGPELDRLLRELPGGVPAEPMSMAEALDRVRRAAELGMNPATPGYLAYIPGGGIFATALASLVSLTLNRYVGFTAASPGMVAFERDVIDLFTSEVGYPEGSGGILTSGGSMASLSAIVAARVDAFGESGDFSRALLYLSTEAHHSLHKAARIAGLPAGNLRSVPVDSAFRLDVRQLEAMISADRRQGYRPFMVIASAGTVNTGAVDPLSEVAECCGRQGLWMHVDGAYGGMFVLTAEGRAKLHGISRADSITLDPHKGLFLPYGCGALVVRRLSTLVAAHAESASYLQDLSKVGNDPSPAELGPELSRNDRGLLVWLPLALHGVDAFRAALQEKLELARHFFSAMSKLEVELVGQPELSIVAFRLPGRAGEPPSEWSERNRAWLARVNDRRRIHLSSTMLDVPDGRVLTLRVCILSFRTDRRWVDIAIRELADTLPPESKAV
jgi:aromatic-L-amino-acid/L-tryptophan decarboxylase